MLEVRKVSNGYIVEHFDGASKEQSVFLTTDELLEFIREYYEG